MHFDNSVTSRIPIPKNILLAKNQISEIVSNIKTIKSDNSDADTCELERQLDEIFYQLYNLSKEEIVIIEHN